MRTPFILTLICLLTLPMLAAGADGREDLLSPVKSPVELTTPEAMTEYLQSDAALLNWPSFILKKEIGVQRDGGRMCAFAIFHLSEMRRSDSGALVMKAAGLFVSALSENGLMHQACVTLKSPGHTARLFIPIEALRKLAKEMDDSAQFSMAQKKELVKACDWREIDAVCDDCTRLAIPSRHVRTPEPTINVLPRIVLKDEVQVDVSIMDEVGDCYLLQDDMGRFMRLKKKDVVAILPPR
jgi:hypothetical protein